MPDLKSIPDNVKWQLAAKLAALLPALYESAYRDVVGEKYDEIEQEIWIDRGVEHFLKHRIFKRSHDLRKTSKPGWTKFGFPLMYQDDTLEILGIMAGLRIRDPRLDDAVELVASKRKDDGRWILESTFNGRFIADIERKGKPSKWITLKALQVLRFYR